MNHRHADIASLAVPVAAQVGGLHRLSESTLPATYLDLIRRDLGSRRWIRLDSIGRDGSMNPRANPPKRCTPRTSSHFQIGGRDSRMW